jgi:hypothetical protein
MDEALCRPPKHDSAKFGPAGWIADFDWQDVGPHSEPIPDGKYKGFTIAKWLPGLVYEYYSLSGRTNALAGLLNRL